MVEWISNLTTSQAIFGAIASNVILFVLSLIVGEILVRIYKTEAVTAPPDPISRAEILLACSCVVLNSLVAIAGWYLWKRGTIILRDEISWRIIRDLFVLIFVMDFFMYVLHRIAHLKWIYPIAHRTHHRYDRPRPINLFVLNPFEVMGFGLLWLIVLSLYPFTWIGMMLFLAFNLISGTLGHLGVEPFPKSWKTIPFLKSLGSSTFHADHHQNEHVNYGFYTTIWDKMFKTNKPQ